MTNEAKHEWGCASRSHEPWRVTFREAHPHECLASFVMGNCDGFYFFNANDRHNLKNVLPCLRNARSRESRPPFSRPGFCDQLSVIIIGNTNLPLRTQLLCMVTVAVKCCYIRIHVEKLNIMPKFRRNHHQNKRTDSTRGHQAHLHNHALPYLE